MNKANKVMYTILAAFLYVAFSVGIGLIIGLFWKMDKTCSLIYWLTKGALCLFVVTYAVLAVLGVKDVGVGAIQIMFTLITSLVPLVARAFYLIPVAGKYVAIIFVFISMILYLLTMLGLGFYAKDIEANSDNKK